MSGGKKKKTSFPKRGVMARRRNGMLGILRSELATPYCTATIMTPVHCLALSDAISSYGIHVLFSLWQWRFPKTHWEESVSRVEKVDTGSVDKQAATFHQMRRWSLSSQAAAGPAAAQRWSMRADSGAARVWFGSSCNRFILLWHRKLGVLHLPSLA